MSNAYLEALKAKLSERDYSKLCAISNAEVHQFIAESAELCNPDDIFICSDSAEDISYVRQQAVSSGEERPLALSGHTYHFDGIYDLGRDRMTTKFLVPEGDSLSPAINQMDRSEGLKEVKGLLKDAMKGRTMIVRFLTLGSANPPFTIYCMECN
jgi:phosphoenolpyruvate carboxykinase (GTP)